MFRLWANLSESIVRAKTPTQDLSASRTSVIQRSTILKVGIPNKRIIGICILMEQLLTSIRDHFSGVGIDYNESSCEAKPGKRAVIFTMPINGENVSSLCQFRVESRFVRIFIPRGSHVPIEKRQEVAELLCRKNWVMSFGAFTMNIDTGEVRFEASIPRQAPFTTREMTTMLSSALLSLDWTCLALDFCVMAGYTPLGALNRADHSYRLWLALRDIEEVVPNPDFPTLSM